MLDEKLIKKLLNKTRLVKFVWDSCSLPLWCVNYLEDATERARELEYITNRYNLDYGVYLYSCNRHKFKLIAVINNKGIRVCR